MRVKFYSIIIFIFLSCSKENNDTFLFGTWHYSKELFLEEEKLLQSPKADLSDIFETIKMVFNDDIFTSYLDDQVTKGRWKIQNDSLYMFLENHGWNKYNYKYLDDKLVIYDREFIIALERKYK